MISAPGLAPRLVGTPVSTIDVTPTLGALAGIDMGQISPWTDGESLLPLAQGGARDAPVCMEYAAEGTVTPMVCLRAGRWKYIRCMADPEMLYDLAADPGERVNLAADPAHAGVLEEFRAKADARWDLAAFDAAVRESQARRWVVYEALRNGAYFPWDHQPLRAASERYMRNHMDLNVLEESKRFPRGE
jgi:choline-sulfatase